MLRIKNGYLNHKKGNKHKNNNKQFEKVKPGRAGFFICIWKVCVYVCVVWGRERGCQNVYLG